MEQIADELLEDGSRKGALRRMLQRGAQFSSGRRMMGLQELLDRLRSARSRNLDRYNLGSILDDIVEKLDNVIDTERRGIRRRLGEDDEDDGSGDAGEGSGPTAQDNEGSSDQGEHGAGGAGEEQQA